MPLAAPKGGGPVRPAAFFLYVLCMTVELNFSEYGEPTAPPLLILHGFLGASGNWHTLSRNVFSRTHHVFALDLRNHGDSPHASEFDLPSMARDVRHFIEERDLAPVDLIGHSMGGKVGMELAIQHPDLIRRLVVVDIAPGAGDGGHESILGALQSVDLSGPTSRDEVDRQLSARISSKPIRQFLLKNLRSAGDNMYEWKNNLPVLAAGYPRINEPVMDGVFEGPTLVISGERSPYIRESDRQEFSNRFPNVRMEVVTGAGHWVHAENPDEFSAKVLDFLDSER